MNDLIGGHVDFLCEQSVSVAEQIRGGAVKAYVVSANQRLAALPDIPSAKESGINYQMSIWAGIFVPKSTPKEIVARLTTALDKALDDPMVKKRISDLGGSIPAKQERTPASFSRLVKAEIALDPYSQRYIAHNTVRFRHRFFCELGEVQYLQTFRHHLKVAAEVLERTRRQITLD
jgi:tripartite-type tricarboxylate transporter receptor subunit TctC